jgi:hypothetical protein
MGDGVIRIERRSVFDRQLYQSRPGEGRDPYRVIPRFENAG